MRKELFDSIATQNAEIRTVAKSLPLFLKQFAKSLFFNRLSQTDKNLKYKPYEKISVINRGNGLRAAYHGLYPFIRVHVRNGQERPAQDPYLHAGLHQERKIVTSLIFTHFTHK